MASFEPVVIPARDTEYIVERLEKHEHMSREEALDCVAELAHYYAALKQGKNGSPSAMIDKAWHAHILNTPMYMEFSKDAFGRYVHHVPFWSGHPSDGNEDDIYEYLVNQLGVDHVNAVMWDREEGECAAGESHSGMKSAGRCQNKCKACTSCNSIG
ncbi:hypothetical protein I4U23_003963 [Adineta vaga]|nr:hypothetical protein I4U23_003963 [Adineta vaga]